MEFNNNGTSFHVLYLGTWDASKFLEKTTHSFTTQVTTSHRGEFILFNLQKFSLLLSALLFSKNFMVLIEKFSMLLDI